MRTLSPHHRRHRALARVALAIVAILTALMALVVNAGPAMAQDDESESEVDTGPNTEAGFVEVFEVSGLLDPILADALEDAIVGANLDGARALVLQLNSPEAVISDERLNELAVQIVESPVPIAVWVGPSGSQAHGKVAQLVALSDAIGVSIGSTLGGSGTQVVDPERFGAIWGSNQELLETTELNWEQAVERGIVACERVDVDELGNTLTPEQSLARCANPTIGDFLVSLDAFEAEIVQTDDGPRLSPITQTRLRGLSLLDQLMHTVASPPVAFLLLIIGMALLIFEFFSIGVGIAGAIGAVLAAMGGYGLGVLPFRTWALVLLVLSMIAFAIDVQTGVPRAWTVIGMVLFSVGTIFLYHQDEVTMSWIPIVVAIVGMGIVMFRGMPLMVRGRFSTTAIDRSFLVDERGTASVGFDDGVGAVVLRDVEWPARSTQAIAAGDSIVVTGTRVTDLDVERV